MWKAFFQAKILVNLVMNKNTKLSNIHYTQIFHKPIKLAKMSFLQARDFRLPVNFKDCNNNVV